MSILEFDYEKQLRFGREEAYEEGMEYGMERGSEFKILSLICKKLQKGKSTGTIADELETDEEFVVRVCEIAKQYAPEYDVNRIYEALQVQI